MKVPVYSVNKIGLEQIVDFLEKNHKKGEEYFTQDMIFGWAAEAQFSLSEGNDATIELKACDSIHGYTQTYTISSIGLDCEMIEVDE